MIKFKDSQLINDKQSEGKLTELCEFYARRNICKSETDLRSVRASTTRRWEPRNIIRKRTSSAVNANMLHQEKEPYFDILRLFIVPNMTLNASCVNIVHVVPQR